MSDADNLPKNEMTIKPKAGEATQPASYDNAQESLQTILGPFPLAIIKLDLEQRVLDWNKAAEHLFGWTKEEVLGEPLPILPDEDDAVMFKNAVERVLKGEVLTDMEIIRINKAGKPVYVNLSLARLLDAAGEVQGTISVIADITERKWAEVVLQNTAKRLSALGTLGQSVLASLELPEVLQTVIDEISPLMRGMVLMSILLLEGEELRVAAVGGEAAHQLSGKMVPVSSASLKEIMPNRHVVELTDISPYDLGLPLMDDGILPSRVYAVPLLSRSKLIGVIEVVQRSIKPLNSDDFQLLEGAANWTAIAITNARQHDEIRRRLEETRAISSISQALSETLEIDRVFKLIVDSADNLIPNADGASILYMDEEEGQLRPVASSVRISDQDPAIPTASVNAEVISEVLKSGYPVNYFDVSQDARFAEMVNERLKSMLICGVRAQSNRYGIILVYSQTVNAFTDADERLLSMLSIEAALAIQNASMYQTERTQRRWAEILAKVGANLNKSLNLDAVLDSILEQISLVIPLSSTHIILIDNNEVQTVRELQGESTPSGHKMPKALMDIQNIREILLTNKPLVITDTRKSVKWEFVPESAWVRSYMGIPMSIGDKIIGLININSVKPNSFTETLVPILKSLTAYAAIAIQNARLYQDLQNALEQEKRMREQLIQSDRLAAMGRMAASIAHEINNPLQGILGCLELAQITTLEASKQQKYLGMAHEALMNLNEIVERILSFQKPLQGTLEKTDVAVLIEEVIALSKKKVQHSDASIVVKLDKNIPKVLAIPSQLKQVFLNLVLNGVESMSAGGVLTIRGEKISMQEQWVQISFEDTGRGISQDELQHLFEPFYSTKSGTNAIGLWVSQSIIDSHRGRITSESEIGKGSKFTVWLPLNPSDNL